MGKYFGTDGFRGEANVVLTVEHAFKVGRYLGWYFGQDHKARIVIGKDTRRSSYMFEYALAAGLTASGADAYLLHVTTTPSVSYVVRTEDFDCGLMISASHNPYYDNGIKVINSEGHKMEAEVEAKIEAYIDGEIDEIPLATKESIGRTVDYAAGRNRYIGHLISLATRSFKDMRVGLDCANGSASSVAKSVFDALGAKTYVINNEPNGVNINTNCGSTHIKVLQEYVKEKHLDIGFAYDGDADRCIAVDENGNVTDYDRPFKVEIDKEMSTGIQGVHFDTNLDTLKIKAGKSNAYVRITFYRTPDLLDSTLTVVLHLIENEHFNARIDEYKKTNQWNSSSENLDGTRYTFKFNEQYSEPTYWSWFGEGFLGPWTPQKYIVVNSVMGWTVNDWSQAGQAGAKVSYGRLGFAAKAVRNYLQEQADNDTPVKDKDGSYMQLADGYTVDYSRYE